jgi:sugar transferase (PEP-CTERM/EpsH1 system associated)
MTPIRILHVVDTLETGGLEHGVASLIQHMNPERFEHEICAIRNRGPLGERLAEQGVRVDCLEKNRPGFSIIVGPLVRRMRSVRPHVVHARNSGTMEAIIAGRLYGACGLVYSDHGVETAKSVREAFHRRCVRRFVYGLADRVVTVSEELRASHAHSTGYPAAKITVLHNGVDTVRFSPRSDVREALRQSLSLAAGEFCIGAVGRLEPVKDHDTLLRAVARLSHHAQKWRLLIAGDGSQSARLRAVVESTPELSGRVVFLGDVPNVDEYLNAMDVYVLPSLSEGIPNALLEAMATGLPAVATTTGGNPEVIVHGESGLLFPVRSDTALSEHLLNLLGTAELARRLGRGARERVLNHFSMDSMCRKYEGLYAGIARPSGGHNIADSLAY